MDSGNRFKREIDGSDPDFEIITIRVPRFDTQQMDLHGRDAEWMLMRFLLAGASGVVAVMGHLKMASVLRSFADRFSKSRLGAGT